MAPLSSLAATAAIVLASSGGDPTSVSTLASMRRLASEYREATMQIERLTTDARALLDPRDLDCSVRVGDWDRMLQAKARFEESNRLLAETEDDGKRLTEYDLQGIRSRVARARERREARQERRLRNEPSRPLPERLAEIEKLVPHALERAERFEPSRPLAEGERLADARHLYSVINLHGLGIIALREDDSRRARTLLEDCVSRAERSFQRYENAKASLSGLPIDELRRAYATSAAYAHHCLARFLAIELRGEKTKEIPLTDGRVVSLNTHVDRARFFVEWLSAHPAAASRSR